MSKYHQIKEKELETTKDYSNKKLDRYIRFHRILRGIYSEWFFWSISIIPFVIFPLFFDNTLGMWIFFTFCHLLYWKFYGEREYHKLSDRDIEELDLTIQVLEDIKNEKKNE